MNTCSYFLPGKNTVLELSFFPYYPFFYRRFIITWSGTSNSLRKKRFNDIQRDIIQRYLDKGSADYCRIKCNLPLYSAHEFGLNLDYDDPELNRPVIL